MKKNSLLLLFSLLAISIGLTACGLGKQKDASQVAAKVNGVEITVHQINQILSRTPGITPENADKARKELLERLIVQELAVAKATDSKLDRTPDVVMALDTAHRDILARAYLSQLAESSANIAPEDIRRYYDNHPEMFSHRRIYSLTDIAFQQNDKLNPPLQGMINANKSMQEIALWLKGNSIKFEAHNTTNAAEQISLEILPSISKLSEGQTTLVSVGQATHIISVNKFRDEPVSFEIASPQIKQYLSTDNGNKIIAAEMKKLREAAKIEYLGEFSAAKPQAATPPAADTKEPAQTKAAQDESIAKGAAGIK
jgi:EpsD family peptidyl-prolyl cis-trans isomerase